MTRKRIVIACVLLIAVVCGTLGLAQRGRRGGGRPRWDPSSGDRRGVPNWQMNQEFSKDVFRFARVRYTSYSDHWRRGKWEVDYPDSDLNFSFRLQQLTALKVNPDPIVVSLTDEKLFDYPFLYMCEPGQITLSEDEVVALRRYLFNGGFMMVDDFWGEREYATFAEQMSQVFPDREPQELPVDHEIFHCVYPLNEKPQIPSIGIALRGRQYGVTWERHDAQEVHYKGIFDDNGRMMVIVCHNTDLGDGWEREGMNEWYFHEFSEKRAYPLGINIVTYAMTH